MAMPKLKILVADGDPRWRRLLANFLGERGFDVVLAKDGWSAISQLRNRSISLIVLSHRVPCINGLDLIEALRETKKIVPIIVMSDQPRDKSAYKDREQEIFLNRFWHRKTSLNNFLKMINITLNLPL